MVVQGPRQAAAYLQMDCQVSVDPLAMSDLDQAAKKALGPKLSSSLQLLRLNLVVTQLHPPQERCVPLKKVVSAQTVVEAGKEGEGRVGQ